METPFAETIRVIRQDGRLHLIQAVDIDGNVLANLPLIGITSEQRVKERGEVGLLLDHHRVVFEDQPA